MYTFNPYVGCTHGCLYCYVPDVLRRRVSESGWGRFVCVKDGVLDRLKADLGRYPPGLIGVSTVTDPYQPVERETGITRQALVIIGAAGFTASIQTKSSMVSRDLDIMRAHKFELGMTLTSMDDRFRKIFEPGASPPEERAQVIEEASSLGIKTWLFYGPIIPGHNDTEGDMSAIVRLAEKTGSNILYDKLNLKPLLKVRLRGALAPEDLLVIQRTDFTKLFHRLEARCRERGVNARYAF
jgi:DNA repair photolyase